LRHLLSPIPYGDLWLDGGCVCAGSSAVAGMWQAANYGDTAEVERLVGQDPGLLNARTDLEGMTPLMLASREGHVGVVRFLLGKEAAVNARSRFPRRTALWWACCEGHPPVVRLVEIVVVMMMMMMMAVTMMVMMLLTAGAAPAGGGGGPHGRRRRGRDSLDGRIYGRSPRGSALIAKPAKRQGRDQPLRRSRQGGAVACLLLGPCGGGEEEGDGGGDGDRDRDDDDDDDGR
jgi:hypothetical protein